MADGGGAPPPVRPRHRRGCLWVLLATLTALVVLAIAAVVARRLLDDGRIRQWEELAALPEASLYYPGAVQLSSAGRDYEVSLFGRVNAFYAQTLGANASMEEVRAFYARELAQRGWVAICEGGPCGSPPGNVWRKGQFLLKFYHEQPAASAGYRTIYSLRISASPLPPTPTVAR